jgi:hypothetical protein
VRITNFASVDNSPEKNTYPHTIQISAGEATCWTVWGSNPVTGKRFSSSPNRPDRFWDPPGLLLNGYRISFREEKRPGRELNHIPPFSADVKNEWKHTSTPPTHLCGMDKNNLTFTYTRLTERRTARCLSPADDKLKPFDLYHRPTMSVV